MEIKFLKAGYCTHPEKMVVSSGKWSSIEFPAMVALIKHESLGYILFDTGYSQRFFEETKIFPYNIYAAITPVFLHEGESIKCQLNQLGISKSDIKYIIISHFHADHIGGCRDFPDSRFICSKREYELLKNKTGLSALSRGFIPNLLPKDFEMRAIFIEESRSFKPQIGWDIFDAGFDIFNDNSIILVPLEGHSIGQFGLYLKNKSGDEYLLVSDACWTSKSYRESVFPNLAAYVIMHDKSTFIANVKKLHRVSKECPNINIIPSHCKETIEREINRTKNIYKRD